MATNLSLDPDLLERALKVSGERTKKAAVTRALEEFIARREQGEFLEWAETYGNLYGSSKIELEKLRAERDVVFAIVDTKGATAYREFVADAVLLMLVAPIEQLKARLLRRKQVSDAELARRMAEAEAEMAFASHCHHTVECFDGRLDDAAFLIVSLVAMRS